MRFFVQGFWMGLLTTSGSLARVVGPIFVTVIYEQYGTYLTFSLVTGSLVLTTLMFIITYRQFVPPDKDCSASDGMSSVSGTTAQAGPESGRETPADEPSQCEGQQ